MDIHDILSLLADICIEYYIAYHKLIRNEDVNVSTIIKSELMNRIYNRYICFTNGYVYEICIMDDLLGKHYILQDNKIENIIDYNEIVKLIYDYINNHKYDIFRIIIPVISIRDHEISNGIIFDNIWIKQIIDLYRY